MKRRPNASKKNRRNRRKRVAKLLEKVHLNAAGIDIGSASHWQSVTSLLRPGTPLTCRALTSRTSKPRSWRISKSGIQ